MIYETLYSSDTRGKILSWWMETDEEGSFRGHSKKGEEGKQNTTGWTLCKQKNIGKKNETSIIEQSVKEVEARYRKKLKSHHHTDKENYLIKFYTEPMLAHKYLEQIKKVWENSSIKVAQPKLDGFRCLLSSKGAFTREGEPIPSIPHIVEANAALFEKYPDMVLELDGELYNHALKDNFEELSSILRKQKVTAEDLEKSKKWIQYHVYDIASSQNQNYFERHNTLAQIFNEFPCEYVHLVPFDEVSSDEQVSARLEEYLEAGYEGAMVRVVDCYYETFHRSNSLLKYKIFFDEEFEIVAVLTGKGSWSNRAKKLLLRYPDGRQFKSGIKGNFAFTQKLLENADKYVGKLATIKYFGLTNGGVPRHGVAIKFHK